MPRMIFPDLGLVLRSADGIFSNYVHRSGWRQVGHSAATKGHHFSVTSWEISLSTFFLN